MDAIYQNLKIAQKKVDALNKLNLQPKKYFLVTAHRQENVDYKDRLKGIFEGLGLIYDWFNLPVIYPIHPRTMKMINEFELKVPSGIKLIEPLGFLEFLQLEKHASLILTDSGGIQMESCILHTPCVTLRDNTEWMETIEVGSNILSGCEPKNILESVIEMIDKNVNWENPFGDGTSASQIIDV